MNRPGLIPIVIGLAVCLIATIWFSLFGSVHRYARSDAATVNKAASLAFGKAATCRKSEYDVEYICTEHPPICNVQTDGEIDWSEAHADCWETICDVEFGVATSAGENGTKDFYYCERDVVGCSDWTGGCISHDVCITGRGPNLAIDAQRTAAFPGHGRGREPSCPYHDKG